MSKLCKFLFAQYRLPYPLYVSGADKSTYEIASFLTTNSYDITCIFCLGFMSKDDIVKLFQKRNINFHHIEGGFEFEYIDSIFAKVYYPDYFFKAYFSFLALYPDTYIFHYCNDFYLDDNSIHEYDRWKKMFDVGINHICFIRSLGRLSYCNSLKNKFKFIFANSTFTQENILSQWNMKSTVILPIPMNSCIADNKSEFHEYITFFNPITVKGANIVYELIQRNQDRYFMIVLGWQDHIHFPKNSTFHNRVLFVPSQQNVAEIYSYSRLVLIPSQWQEAFGRIQFEAAMNNIPVCISSVGGLKYYFSDNGVSVTNFQDVNAWQNAIESLDEPEFYNTCVKNSAKLVRSYSFESEMKKFMATLLT